MKITAVFILLFILNLPGLSFAQVTDYELGSSLLNRYSQQTGFFDLSDPNAVNIKVAIWGFVRYPGKYVVPSYTTVLDLLSYAGGPSESTDLDKLRLYRIKEDGKQELVLFDYNDIMWSEKIEKRFRSIPDLEAGDILIVPGSPRYYTRDDISFWVSITSALVTIAILVLNLIGN